MEIIYKERQTGKTKELIELCHETGGYIVCMDRQRAKNIKYLADKLVLSIRQPITFSEFLDKQYYSAGIKCFYIDDAEVLLQHLSHIEIKAITITKKD